jgi:hypothetical protein
MRVAVVRGLACAVLLAHAASTRAQEANLFEVSLRFSDGRFVTDRSSAMVRLTSQAQKTLRPGVTEARLEEEFCDALDRRFREMRKVYYFTLTDADKARDERGGLDEREDLDPGTLKRQRTWNGPIAQFPGLEFFQEGRANPGSFDEQLEGVKGSSALAEWLNPDARIDRPLQFRVRDPLIVSNLVTPATGALLDRDRVLALLGPFDRLPADPGRLQTALLDVYTVRGLTPKIDIDLDRAPPQLSIFDTMRIARLLLPADLRDASVAERIAYNALPRPFFRAFRRAGAATMSAALPPGATKREIDLRALFAASQLANGGASPALPPVDAGGLAEIQQRLLLLGFSGGLFDRDPSQQLMDLVIERNTPETGAATGSNIIGGTAETPSNSAPVSAAPGAATGLQPPPIVPAPQPDGGRLPGSTPRREQKNFLGGGLEYRPGQGIRAFGQFQRKNSFGLDLTQIEAGGMGSGFGSGRYSRDYLFFGALGRRLSVDVNGGSDFQRQRIIGGVLADERRNGGGVRADIEAFRDGPDRQVDVFGEARRDVVSLTPVSTGGSAGATVRQTITSLDLGAVVQWRRSLVLHPAMLRIDPRIRLGNPLGDVRFGRVHLGARYHQSIAGPVEAEARVQFARATARTPLFERPSLGGSDSVRGFRTDERVGRALWASQQELWLPLPVGGSSKASQFVRRNMRIASFYDVGGLDAFADSPEANGGRGFRHGAGAGLRVRYQGVIIEADWAYGFGNQRDERPGRGRFYFNFRLP